MSSLINVRDFSDLVLDFDWAPAFAEAIAQALVGRRGGILVPADPEDYTVRKSASKTPSIDLRGLSNFTVVGEGDGSRIRMLGSGLGGSWSMIAIGGNSSDVVLRGLYLDGDRENLTELDDGQHTHTVQIGGTASGGFAHRIRIVDCTLTDMDGDGIAIAALSGAFGAGDEVSSVDIVGCKFLNCGRSGVSNQRSAEFVRIHGCHFEGTSDQDIDFEPSGSLLGTAPRRYSITDNTIIHNTPAAAITLSGVGSDIPSQDNTLALNRVYGGRVGMVNTQNILIFGNYVESGLADPEAVFQMRGTTDGAIISHNQFVRVSGAEPGKTLNISSRATQSEVSSVDHVTDTLRVNSHRRITGAGPASIVALGNQGGLPSGLHETSRYWLIRIDDNTLSLAASATDAFQGIAVELLDNGHPELALRVIDYPRAVTVDHNRIVTYAHSDDDECVALVTNADGFAFTANDIASNAGVSISHGIRLITTRPFGGALGDWAINNNRLRGNTSLSSNFINGIAISAVGVAVGAVSVNDNSFRDCDTRILWTVGGDGIFTDIPTARGNTGEGIDFAGLDQLPAVRIGGSSSSQGDFIFDAGPGGQIAAFPAIDGSTARRRPDGELGPNLYVLENGAWIGK